MDMIGRRSFLAASLLVTLLVSLATLNASHAQEEPLTVFAFKRVYSVGMTVTLFGDVTGSFTPNENVSVKVTNPNGQTYKNANAKLDEEGSYTFQFKIEGAQASVLGVHTVEATYKSLTATTSFEVVQKPTLSISLDKTSYDIGDLVVVSGTVNPVVREPIEIRIYGFNNTAWKFVTVNAQNILNDGTFSVEVGELLGKNVKAGRYRVEASYADGLATAMLQFDVTVSGKAVVGRLMPVDQTGRMLNEIFTGQQVLLQADVRNNLDERQPFAYLVLIKDANGITVSLSWITGTLPPSETLSAAQSWVPEEAGRFTVEVFLWESVATPVPLTAKVPTISIIVEE